MYRADWSNQRYNQVIKLENVKKKLLHILFQYFRQIQFTNQTYESLAVL